MGAVILAGKGEYRDWRAIATLQDAGLMPAGRKPADVAAPALTPKA